jgi:hypothetical protein
VGGGAGAGERGHGRGCVAQWAWVNLCVATGSSKVGHTLTGHKDSNVGISPQALHHFVFPCCSRLLTALGNKKIDP